MDEESKTETPNSFKIETPKAEIKKSWFTPCRRIGLKRKSSGHTPGSNVSLNNTPNSSFKSHKPTLVTPDRDKISCDEQNPRVNEVSTPIAKFVTSTEHVPLQNSVSKLLGNISTTTPIRKTPHVVRFMPPVSAPITEESIEQLRNRVKDKEDRVNTLKLTQMKEKKRDTGTLTELTQKWRRGCQEALQQLHEKTKSLGYNHSMSELLQQLKIPFDLVQYEPESDEFKE